MELRYQAGRSVRHVAGAMTEAALVVAIAVALVFAVSAATGQGPAGADSALAGKGRANSTASSSISLNSSSDLWFGGKVTFSSNPVSLTGNEYPMVIVSCYQGSDLVYRQLDHPDAAFVLGGGSSRWWDSPGPAGCEAGLYSYGGKSIRLLAGPVSFDATG